MQSQTSYTDARILTVAPPLPLRKCANRANGTRDAQNTGLAGTIGAIGAGNHPRGTVGATERRGLRRRRGMEEGYP